MAVHSANAVVYGKIADKIGVKGVFSMDLSPAYTPLDADGIPGSSYVPRDVMVNFGVAYKFLPFLSIGASMRYLSTIPSSEYEFSAIAADIFLSGAAGPVRITAGVTSLGSTLKSYDLTDFKLPMAASVGVSYSQTFGKVHRVEANLQGDWFLSGGPRVAVGAAYSFNRYATARVGYNYGGNTPLPSFFSAGIGTEFLGINLNATVLFGSTAPINGSFQIGLGYTIRPGKASAGSKNSKENKGSKESEESEEGGRPAKAETPAPDEEM